MTFLWIFTIGADLTTRKIHGESYRLKDAKSWAMVFQLDHSMFRGVSGNTYDFIVNLVRAHSHYPLDLGQYDLDMSHSTGEG